ncbi:MAG: hypothetical protein ICV85_13430 [Tolypothrix sp. T3-bin4]|nr:hypothetical protein [Tolypothrix sp. T3-bin4]
MTMPSLNTIFLLAGLLFLLISVLGPLKIGFAEINPGLFGRIVALIVGLLCLIITALLIKFPAEFLLDLIRNSLVEQIQQTLVCLPKLNNG